MRKLSLFAAGLAALALAVLAGVETPAHAQSKGKEIAGTGSGTIKGKITTNHKTSTDGKVKIDPNNKDASHCMKGDTEDLTWVVGDGGALADVVVYLKAPAGAHFKVDTSKKTWQDEVDVDQPYCAFRPHVMVLFPQYEGKATGQKFVIKNSAPMLHNTRVQGSPLKNPTKNYTIPAGKQEKHDFKADTQAIKLNCDAHKWMEGYIWAFDHPYAAVTGKDGSFEIKNVPTGVEVSVWAWHESDGASNSGREIKKASLKDGDTITYELKK